MYAKRAHAGETFLDKGQGLWSTSGEMLEPEGSTTTGGMQTGFWTGWYHGQDRSSTARIGKWRRRRSRHQREGKRVRDGLVPRAGPQQRSEERLEETVRASTPTRGTKR